MFWIAQLYVVAALAMSLVSVAAYGIDKRRAVSGGRRISENTLHVFALLGGWPGALVGQRLFRHKTVKLSFRVVLWAIVTLHVAAIVFWVVKYFGQ